MKLKRKEKLNLQLFSESGVEAVNSQSGENISADAGQVENSVTADDEFESLIDGKFKEQFRKRTQSIIDKRFKETKQLEEFKESVSPLIQKLNEKYGVDEGDTKALAERIFNKENEIDNKNTSNEKAEHNTLKEQVASWVKETDEIKEFYPDFDFKNELKNSSLFGKLLYNGVPLKTAFEVIHKDEILSGAMTYTAQKVREQVVKGIEAKGRRPLENGIASESGIVTLTDVNALTSKDILKILKQVENGANVKF
ncbi:MAG: hypothetical protein E7557_01590 [Ruminococcaceae bacterium]|nr:hypothetical protein [Oscillospiraceae bacterium]